MSNSKGQVSLRVSVDVLTISLMNLRDRGVLAKFGTLKEDGYHSDYLYLKDPIVSEAPTGTYHALLSNNRGSESHAGKDGSNCLLHHCVLVLS